jgi:hypothetical protein
MVPPVDAEIEKQLDRMVARRWLGVVGGGGFACFTVVGAPC